MVEEEIVQDGFRKGVTKESLIKNMTKADWVRIDKTKEAQEKKIENEIAYKAFLMNDQLRQSYENLLISMDENLCQAMDTSEAIIMNNLDIEAGVTEQKDDTGKVLSVPALKIHNVRLDILTRKIRLVLIANINKLYTFVNHMGLDKEIFFNEEQYDRIAKDTISRFEKSGYKLFE